jgi:HNH endonuclease
MVCNTCGEDKTLQEFPKNGVDSLGIQRHRADCTMCYNIKRKVNKKKFNKFVNNTKHRTGEVDTYTIKDWRNALLYFGGCCAYCGAEQSRRRPLTKEHVVPVDKGGATVKHNIVPGCKSCNSSKGASDMETWYRKHEKFSVDRLNKIRRWCSE